MQPNRNGTSMTNRLNRSRPTKAALAVAADITQEVTDCFRRASWAGAYGLSFGLTSSAREPHSYSASRRRNLDFARRKSALARDHGTRRIRSSWRNLALLQPVQDRKVGWRLAKGVSNRNSGTVTNFTAVSRTGIVAWMAAWVRRLSQGAAIRVTKCPKRPAANVPRVMSSNASHE